MSHAKRHQDALLLPWPKKGHVWWRLARLARLTALLLGSVVGFTAERPVAASVSATTSSLAMTVAELPTGPAPQALRLPHFPTRFHAFVWRNWELVTAERMAAVAGTTTETVIHTGQAMGLPGRPGAASSHLHRAAITLIRRNWHLLPYDQLLELLGWTPEQMVFALREDDFLFIKLGSLKPACVPLRWEEPTEEIRRREREVAATVRDMLTAGAGTDREPLFAFVGRLSGAGSDDAAKTSGTDVLESVFPPHNEPADAPRICYSYFALYGDPLLDQGIDPYLDALLARLAQTGINGIWLQGILNRLAPFPWDPSVSEGWQTRMENLRRLTTRARRHGIGVYLYLNEPRTMPRAFHAKHPGLQGVTEGEYAALCTRVPEVQAWITDAVASVCREVPDLAGFFTISGSENLTNCWSHGRGSECPRCAEAGAAEVIADLHRRILEGIRRSGSKARLIVWDWGWPHDWAEGVIARLPSDVALMSTSEWELPIRRGGVETTVGEYSISAVGPGPRAKRHWRAARARGLQVLAKIQAGNTWELSSVPWIPVADQVARHLAALREEGVRGGLFGWTLGGHPSPNLEVAAVISSTSATAEQALRSVAKRRYGPVLASAVVQAWKEFSTAFSEFPFHTGVVYTAPLQMGPANLLWENPTGYRATMVGLPYDDLDSWRSVYPLEVFRSQLLKVADGFDTACARLARALEQAPPADTDRQWRNAREELTMAQAAAIHFRSAANQARFVELRAKLLAPDASAEQRRKVAAGLRQILTEEADLARRLRDLQERDSRIGFEASNQYFYTPLDLAEKVLNCRDLLERWLPDVTEDGGWENSSENAGSPAGHQPHGRAGKLESKP